mmetsp:Transcript_85420/g.190762  ORF Transcript_85420/g.190762 Transcript_85420/m.190762 type:complete len:377 (+) Transcript_85420:80-1210(+)
MRMGRAGPSAVDNGRSADEEAPSQIAVGVMANWPAAVLSSRSHCLRFFSCLLDVWPGDRRWLRVQYPLAFKVFGLLALGMSAFWLMRFVIAPWPEYAAAPPSDLCQYNKDQLRYNANALSMYFISFAVVRLPSFLPCVAARIADMQSGAQGLCCMYIMHMVLHGPLYVFGIGSALFWIQIMQAPGCEVNDPHLYNHFKMYALYSCFISVLCLFLVYWQSKIIGEAARLEEEYGRRAPPGALSAMVTCLYNPALFGDEEGKQYPAECPICLAAWERHEVIKVTPCGHAFHEECLGRWLQSERTCAICRRDVTSRLSVLAAKAYDRRPAWGPWEEELEVQDLTLAAAALHAQSVESGSLGQEVAVPVPLSSQDPEAAS